jgi:DNA-binding transcriptional LysR family regulator
MTLPADLALLRSHLANHTAVLPCSPEYAALGRVLDLAEAVERLTREGSTLIVRHDASGYAAERWGHGILYRVYTGPTLLECLRAAAEQQKSNQEGNP